MTKARRLLLFVLAAFLVLETAPAKANRQKCGQILKAIGSAQNLSAADRAVKRLSLRGNELASCASTLLKDSRVKSLVGRELKSKGSRRSARRTPPKPIRTPAMRTLQKAAPAQYARLKAQRRAPSSTRTVTRRYQPPPQITSVVPATIMPSVAVLIAGKAFGTEPGSVRLSVGNREFDVSVQDWQDELIFGVVGGNVTGVFATNSASLKVKTKANKEASRTIPFEPLLVRQTISYWLCSFPEDFGACVHPEPKQFLRVGWPGKSLKNQWLVEKIYLSVQTCGFNLKLFGPRVASPGQASLETEVIIHQPWSVVGIPSAIPSAFTCDVWADIRGPMGTDSGVPYSLP